MRGPLPIRAAVLFLPLLLAPLTRAAAQEGVRIAIQNEALKHRGVPYVYGAMGPRGFDCSGFTSWVFLHAAGISLPRTARGQANAGRAVPLAEARAGDLLIFDTVGGRPSHVGILLENRQFAHAASAGPTTGIIVSNLSERYYATRIIGVRRLLADPAAMAAAPPGTPAAAPTQAPAAPRPSAAAPAAAPTQAPAPRPLPEPSSEPILLSVTNRLETVSDRIPAARGSSLQFLVRNDSGRDATFEILFYKLDRDPSKHRTLRRDRVQIPANAIYDLAPLAFPQDGQYRLIIKTHDNFKRLERTWAVKGM